jgi:glycerol kinase
MTVVLAIDQRVSGATAVVVDEPGNVLTMSQQTVGLRRLPGGRTEQDPREVLAAVVQAGRVAATEAEASIDVVALTTPGESVLAWDRDTGRPLSSLIICPDQRVNDNCAGLVLNAGCAAPKLAWLRRHVTDDGVVTTADSWLIHQLTGEFVTDASTASHSLLADLDTVSWNPNFLGLFGLAYESLPMIVPSDQIVGATIAFGGSALVGGLVVGQSATMIGEGCLGPADTTCTFGSGATLLANAGATPPLSRAGLAGLAAWRVRGETTYSISGRVSTAASVVPWMKQLGYITNAGDMDKVAASDAGGVLAVPALDGLGVPWWRPDARACLSGMTHRTTVGHLVVAILQGIAAQVAALGSTIAGDLGQPLIRLGVDGGLTQCRTFMQALADLMQIDIEVHPSTPTTALGAAAVSRIAVDRTLSLADALGAVTPSTVFTPHWPAEQAADFRSRWAKAVEAA